MERRIITTDVLEEDVKIEGSLRPQHLDDYIGQEKTKKNLKVYIEAAKQRSDVLDHVLFYALRDLEKQRWQASLQMRWNPYEGNERPGDRKTG